MDAKTTIALKQYLDELETLLSESGEFTTLFGEPRPDLKQLIVTGERLRLALDNEVKPATAAPPTAA